MWLYNIAIDAMRGGIKVASAWSKKQRLWVKGRKGIFGALSRAIKPDDKVAWFHCASLGEFEQGRPVIEELRRIRPDYKILLTFFSPSGYEIRKDYRGADWVFYLPADTPSNARRFVQTVHPEIAVFVKYEFWLNTIDAARRSGCRLYLISAIFRPNQVFFKPYGGAFRRALAAFDTLFVQDGNSVALLERIGVHNVIVAGDTRFDRVSALAAAAKPIDIVERFAAGRKVFLAGSTWGHDEDILLPVINRHPDLKFIVAPHEMDEMRIARLMSETRGGAVRYTRIEADTDLALAQLLIIDTIGILSSAYRYASLGYIGGGFGVGIHNTLEAATFGLPIAFGPNYKRFREACDMISIGSARSVGSAEELEEWTASMLGDEELYARLSESAKKYVEEHKGATDIILRTILK